MCERLKTGGDFRGGSRILEMEVAVGDLEGGRGLQSSLFPENYVKIRQRFNLKKKIHVSVPSPFSELVAATGLGGGGG